MKLSNLIVQNSFKTLPDGNRVFFAYGFLQSAYLLIPDKAREDVLFRKVLWINICALILGVGGMFVFGYFTNGRFITSFIFIWWGLIGIIRSVIVRKDISNFKKVELTRETTYFYDNFTNKVQVGVNAIPKNYEISKYLDVPGSDDKVLLLRYKDMFPLILRCRLGGSIAWQSEFNSEHNDTYANIEWKNGNLHVFSKSNTSIMLDPNTGTIASSQ